MLKYLSLSFAFAACSSSATNDQTAATTGKGSDALPVQKIQDIVGADGHVDNGVLDITIERKDISSAQGPRGITFTPAFGLESDLYFQPLGGGKAFLNGDFALKESEVDPFVKALIQNGLDWQAFHQHTPMQPQIWFVHYRGVCDPDNLAKGIRAAIDTTSTPLPQQSPQNPTSPLDDKKLASILHGTAQIGEEGVVTVSVPRKHGVKIENVQVQPETGISVNIQFKPTGNGSEAQVVPDFGMTSEEIMPAVQTMFLDHDWDQGCLYNQETGEQPQLYLDHMAKQGDAYQLAREIRDGLDHLDVQ